jgi:hypothetical protein
MIAVSYMNLASLRRYTNDYKDVESLYQNAHMIFKKNLGEYHPNTMLAFKNTVSFYRETQKSEDPVALAKSLLQ